MGSKTKFKYQNIIKKKGTCKDKLLFGTYGLQALSGFFVTTPQVSSIVLILKHSLKPLGHFWLRVFPDRSVSCKPIDFRMGAGKGEIKYMVSTVRKGQILLEVSNIGETKLFEVLNIVAYKLSKPTKIIKKI